MLPELPKQNKQDEAAFGLLFRSWHRKSMVEGVFELKHSKGKAVIRRDVVEAGQVAWGMEIMTKGRLIRVIGSTGEPDYVWAKCPSYVVVRWVGCFTLIRMDVWIGMGKTIKEDEAKQKALVVVSL